MRERVLERVRQALRDRPRVPHPGALDTGAPDAPPPVEHFTDCFRAAGGEVQRFADADAARRWLQGFAARFASVSHGAGVPASLALPAAKVPPREAALGVSVARAAAAQSGSLVLSSRDGRRTQLLPPVHVVLIDTTTIAATLGEALAACRGDGGAALALHSGPSKSADIGQVMVTGVHGPGRVIAVLLDDWPGA
jgi:L-lactate dehydrogenase complex protein LldG